MKHQTTLEAANIDSRHAFLVDRILEPGPYGDSLLHRWINAERENWAWRLYRKYHEAVLATGLLHSFAGGSLGDNEIHKGDQCSGEEIMWQPGYAETTGNERANSLASRAIKLSLTYTKPFDVDLGT
ncbi:hypothetical protein EVAR_73257_1 [Eumeta japonica]|uniref:Uncharacterized protein n=1 Tax=Eumeta variegata TaxID=151549 RepID=A0A4C1SGB2_EUMVA|nr:hypothetical protein EVAR_73257_1 [Eumeta japonica]